MRHGLYFYRWHVRALSVLLHDDARTHSCVTKNRGLLTAYFKVVELVGVASAE